MADARFRQQMTEVQMHLQSLRSSDQRFDFDPVYHRVGTAAMGSPRMLAIKQLSPAWYAAFQMLDSYATLSDEDEMHYRQKFDIHTREEVAEQQMRFSNYNSDGMTPRVFNVAAITALHSLNWARAES